MWHTNCSVFFFLSIFLCICIPIFKNGDENWNLINLHNLPIGLFTSFSLFIVTCVLSLSPWDLPLDASHFRVILGYLVCVCTLRHDSSLHRPHFITLLLLLQSKTKNLLTPILLTVSSVLVRKADEKLYRWCTRIFLSEKVLSCLWMYGCSAQCVDLVMSIDEENTHAGAQWDHLRLWCSVHEYVIGIFCTASPHPVYHLHLVILSALWWW